LRFVRKREHRYASRVMTMPLALHAVACRHWSELPNLKMGFSGMPTKHSLKLRGPLEKDETAFPNGILFSRSSIPVTIAPHLPVKSMWGLRPSGQKCSGPALAQIKFASACHYFQPRLRRRSPPPSTTWESPAVVETTSHHPH
jgi:hypothetical protein